MKKKNVNADSVIDELEIIKASNERIIANIKKEPCLSDYKQGYLKAIISQNKSLKNTILCKKNIVNTPF